MTDQPLGKPIGTVRAYLAVGLVGAFTVSHLAAGLALALTGHVTESVALLGVLSSESAVVLGFYFGTRQTAAQ